MRVLIFLFIIGLTGCCDCDEQHIDYHKEIDYSRPYYYEHSNGKTTSYEVIFYKYGKHPCCDDYKPMFKK